MPLMPFQPGFVPMIYSGRKPHTIRRKRKVPIKAGDLLHSVFGPRFKPVKFAVLRVLEVVPVTICENYVQAGNRRWDTPEALNSLAYADGFDDWKHMAGWFRERYGALPPEGEFVMIFFELVERVGNHA